MTTVAMVLTSHDQLGETGRSTGWYVPEAAHPWRLFSDAGFEMVWVSPGGGQPAMDGVDLADPVQQAFLAHYGSQGPDTVVPAELDPAAIDVVFYVGGHGAMWDLRTDAALSSLAGAVYDDGGTVAAVCHGPAGIVDIRLADGSWLVDGKEVAAFTNDEESVVGLTDVVPFLLQDALVARGARHRAAERFSAQVVADGRLVTGQNPASAVGVAAAVIEVVTEATGRQDRSPLG